jgi:hypothetical protein
MINRFRCQSWCHRDGSALRPAAEDKFDHVFRQWPAHYKSCKIILMEQAFDMSSMPRYEDDDGMSRRPVHLGALMIWTCVIKAVRDNLVLVQFEGEEMALSQCHRPPRHAVHLDTQVILRVFEPRPIQSSKTQVSPRSELHVPVDRGLWSVQMLAHRLQRT